MVTSLTTFTNKYGEAATKLGAGKQKVLLNNIWPNTAIAIPSCKDISQLSSVDEERLLGSLMGT